MGVQPAVWGQPGWGWSEPELGPLERPPLPKHERPRVCELFGL